MSFKKMLEMIPEAFANLPESNFGKIFLLLDSQLSKVKETAETIEQWHDMDLAEGATLDRIGEDYEVVRGSDNDYLYRFRIKSKIATAQSNGTFDEIINVICKTINADPKDVSVIKYKNEPLAIQVESVPIKYFNDTGIKISSFVESVRAAAAAGVRVESIVIESANFMEIQYKRTLYRILYQSFAGDGTLSGEFPYESYKSGISENNVEVAQEAKAFVIHIPLTGENPFVNTVSDINNKEIEPGYKSESFRVIYPLAGDDNF